MSMLHLVDICAAPAAGVIEADEAAAGAKVNDWPVWECNAWPDPAGRFTESRWWESRPGVDEERCYVIHGRATLRVREDGDDRLLTLKAGDRVVFKKGFQCEWEVTETIAKHYEYFDASGAVQKEK